VEQIVVFQNFIVLGIIPGTNVQINFGLWLALVSLAILVWELRRFWHSDMLAAIQLHRALGKTTLANLSHINDISL
jgi:hypothetical protein